MIVAQISDLHIRVPGKLAYRVVDTSDFLRRAVARLNVLEPAADIILATGDLTDAGDPAEYAHLRELLAPLRAPVYVVPGNHDHRDELRNGFGASYLPRAGHLSYVIEKSPLRIIALDSTAPGEEGGHIDDERARWLEERLAEDSRPTMIAMHHPPFTTGLWGMDRLGFVGLESFGAVVARHRHVVRITAGHIHRSIVANAFGTVVTVAPSVAHQLTLELRPEVRATFSLEPPGFLLHQFESGALVTHVATFGDYEGPFPFREASGEFLR
ncbi:MAG: phosphodiesterase [Vulcanimicrobiaceae bacterium]